MSDDPFGLDNDKELDAEDYAYREDDEKHAGGGGGPGCCLILLLPVSVIVGTYQLIAFMTA